ncbi:MAG: hypothetical protein HFJ58_07795 [Clostridia bacterium]|nr:hypothetical protein [Clostridia bacterium]
MIKKIILGVVLAIVILYSVVLANSSMQEASRRNNVNCNNCIYYENCIKENCIMTEKCKDGNCINQNCDIIRKQQRNQNCSNQNENCTQRQYKRMCH